MQTEEIIWGFKKKIVNVPWLIQNQISNFLDHDVLSRPN